MKRVSIGTSVAPADKTNSSSGSSSPWFGLCVVMPVVSPAIEARASSNAVMIPITYSRSHDSASASMSVVFNATNPCCEWSAMNTIRRSGFGFFSGCVNSMTEQLASRTRRRATLPRNGCNTISFSSAPAISMSIFSRVSAAKMAWAGSPSS